MTKQKLTAMAMAALTALTPAATTNAAIVPSDTDDIVSENDDTSKEATDEVTIDKIMAIENSVKLTDKIAAENRNKNIMLSPTSLNFALGMIAEGAKGETKEALKEENVVSTIVDNEIAVENLTKFAKVKNYTVNSKKEGEDYIVEISKGDEEADFEVEYTYADCSLAKPKMVVVCASNVMGSDPDLGAILMKSFIFSLTKQDVLPDEMIFYNEGVKITTTKSETLEDLKYLADNGVEIVSCGTCLDFFHLKEELQVGSVTNMYDIVERMEKADKIIKP